MYILIAIASYLLNAAVYVADKFLLSKKVHSSIVYAFYVGIWSVGNFVLLFFDPFIPDWWQLGLDIAAGLLFLFTLISSGAGVYFIAVLLLKVEGSEVLLGAIRRRLHRA